MNNKYIWIGITVGVFFAGIGIGHVIYTNTYNPGTIMQNPQLMQKMMQDPQFHQQMMNSMIQNPQLMNQWAGSMMQNQQFMQGIHNSMMQNPQHVQWMGTMMGPNMMGYMMNDPNLRQQVYDNMLEHHEFMEDLMKNQQFQQNWMGPWMMNNTNWRGMMCSGMMSNI